MICQRYYRNQGCTFFIVWNESSPFQGLKERLVDGAVVSGGWPNGKHNLMSSPVYAEGKLGFGYIFKVQGSLELLSAGCSYKVDFLRTINHYL